MTESLDAPPETEAPEVDAPPEVNRDVQLPAEEKPVATLFLHGVKSGKHMNVHGISGKRYEFRFDEKLRLLVRRYTNAVQFAREELDMRKSRAAQFIICTLMGSPHPVAAAHEALEALITDFRSVMSPQRREALVAIVARAQTAIEAIDNPPDEEDEAAPIEPEVVSPPSAPLDIALPDAAWKKPDGKPIETRGGKIVTRAQELMETPWSDLKEIATSHSIQTGRRTRADVVNDIVRAEKGA